MPLAIAFWVLMIVWAVFQAPFAQPYPWGGKAVFFILLGILGWATFGAPIK
jgi:hypothetical protein